MRPTFQDQRNSAPTGTQKFQHTISINTKSASSPAAVWLRSGVHLVSAFRIEQLMRVKGLTQFQIVCAGFLVSSFVIS